MRSTAAPYTESRLTRSVANERVGFPVVEHPLSQKKLFSTKERVLFLAVIISNCRNIVLATREQKEQNVILQVAEMRGFTVARF